MYQSRFKKYFLIIALVIIFILLGLFLFLSRPGKNIINPMIDSVYRINLGIGWIGEKFNSNQVTAQENEKLKQEIIDLSTENAQLRSCWSENQVLQRQLNFSNTENYSMITGRVIGKLSEFAGADSVFIFNQGDKDGVKVGYPLVLANTDSTRGILVGKVIKTAYARSYFILINNYHSDIAGLLLNKEEESTCLVSGSRDGVMEVVYLPINKNIAQEDVVITSGLEDDIPKGLLIGKVSSIDSEPGSLFHNIKLNSIISMKYFDILSVVIPQIEVK